MNTKVLCISIALMMTFAMSVAQGQVFDERFTDWPTQLKIDGRLIVAGARTTPDVVEPLLSRADREKTVFLICDDESADSYREGFEAITGRVERLESWEDIEGQRAAGEESFIVAWHTPRQGQGKTSWSNEVADELRAHLGRGDTLILFGSIARWVSRKYVDDEAEASDTTAQVGVNLFLDSLLCFDFDEKSDSERLLSVLSSQPKLVGIGIEPRTALMLSGRKMLVSGEGRATFLLPATDWLPKRMEFIVPRTGGKQRVTDFLADLTEWRRDAIDRTLEPFPTEEPRQPKIDAGTLFIVGGGGMPSGLMKQFVQDAGGVDDARLVYVPCSESERVSQRQSIVEQWRRMGVKHATFLHTKDRLKANEDEDFYRPLKEATGLWFGGGRQWNFADSYYGTTTHRLMKEVLHRGGVVGGSSAGASIQARYLARATPIENFRPMAPGYERGGLGFLSGVAIDQHFSQRGRHSDMTKLVDRYPQLLGIGIDESTALIVRGSVGTIVGEGRVHFYDRNRPIEAGEPDYVALGAGREFDLVQRVVLDSEESPVGN